MQIIVNVGGLGNALTRASRLASVKTGLAAAGLELAGEMKRYPPVSRRKQPFKTRKQQRAFFAMLKKGTIQVPYVRGMNRKSQKLGQSWTTKATGMTVVVGTAVRYAPLVQGDKQATYHKVTGWKTAETVARAFERRVPVIVESYIRREL